MNDVIIFLAIGDVFLLIYYLIQEKSRQDSRRKELNAPCKAPSREECVEASKLTISFINDRLWEMKYDAFVECKVGMNEGFFGLYDSHILPNLFHNAHMAGYRVVLVKEGDSDIENPKNTKDVLKKYHKNWKLVRHMGIEKKYSGVK